MRIFLLLIFSIVLSGCSTNSPTPSSNMPAPTVSKYVKTEGGGFIVERNIGIKYGMTYKLLKSSEPATSYKVVFENTIPNGNPITIEGNVEPGNSKLIVQSPAIPGVRNNKIYSVILTLYVNGTKLVTHNDRVKFLVPSEALAQFGIVEY